MKESSKKDILYTIAYFNAMKYPLTTFELWRFFMGKEKVSFGEVMELLKSESVKKKVQIKNGFISLKEDADLCDKRLKNQKISMTSIRKIRRWARIFSFIPYVRGVFITGTLSMRNARKESDWDILLVLAKNRIWIGRLFTGATLHFFRKRRHGDKVKRRFCLNHYLTESGLILEERSEYSAYFTTFSFPAFGGTIHKKFLQLNEHWTRSIYPNYEKDAITESDIFFVPVKDFFVKKVMERFLEKTKLAERLNSFAKKIMIKKIQKNPKTYLENADIRYSDCALIFLPNPHRIEVGRIAKDKLTKALT